MRQADLQDMHNVQLSSSAYVDRSVLQEKAEVTCENRHSETFQACEIKRLAATFKLAVIGGEFNS